MKKIILIDLDNTLIDFNECARHSIIDIFNKFQLPYSDNVFHTFITENVKIWKRLENGEITKEEYDRWRYHFPEYADSAKTGYHRVTSIDEEQ